MKIEVVEGDREEVYEISDPTAAQIACHVSSDELVFRNQFYRAKRRLYSDEEGLLIVFVEKRSIEE